MTTYVDTSALLKRYISEPDSDVADAHLAADPVLVTSWITVVEARRNLSRLLTGADLVDGRRRLMDDLDRFAMISVDQAVCQAAAEIADVVGVRSLDSIHLACAQRLQLRGLTFLTFDLRQAQAARSMGFVVTGS